ncbi:MAG: HD domain-containing protein, partial [Bacteroidetes bacterium]|nr:HD domain-containing protein [Bacteroidota bacterium]
MKVATQILSATEAFARDILTNKIDKEFTYHTLPHTVQVVDATEEIGRHIGLTNSEIEVLKVAAWLHDLGYVRKYIGHERDSIAIAREFLTEQNADEALIVKVENLIEATILEQKPRNTLEEVIKDADLFNLATPEALENSQMIRYEWKVFCNRTFSDKEWDEFNYNFFREHEYYTPYGKEYLDPIKQSNIKKLKKALKRRRQKENETEKALLVMQLEKQESRVDKLKRKLKKAKQQRPDRGIETMFRTTYRTHMNLSSIADNKANILLSINAIIVSIVLTDLIGKLEDYAFILIPGATLLLVCMVTIVFAILATRPKVSSVIFTREDILEKKTNLLFFGNFFRMDLIDFQWGIKQMMNDAEYLYGSMSKDIYFLGKVLAKKF